MTVWAVIQENQTLTVGTLGFVGVICSVLLNAGLARKALRDERRHERETLRAALIVELQINRAALDRNVDSINDAPKTWGLIMPTDLMDDAYRAFTHRIGLLSQAEVSKVMNAYLSLRTYNAKLFLLADPAKTGPRHVGVPPESGPMLSELLKTLMGPIDEAIEVMERARVAD